MVYLMYLLMFAKIVRPYLMALIMTPRSLSSRMISAFAFATSVAESTAMPTSASLREGASLMPSP